MLSHPSPAGIAEPSPGGSIREETLQRGRERSCSRHDAVELDRSRLELRKSAQQDGVTLLRDQPPDAQDAPGRGVVVQAFEQSNVDTVGQHVNACGLDSQITSQESPVRLCS